MYSSSTDIMHSFLAHHLMTRKVIEFCLFIYCLKMLNMHVFSMVTFSMTLQLLGIVLDVSTTLTLKVLVTTIDAQWEGMGDVGSAR